MKVKIEVKSWNNYSSPHTHTSGEGDGLFDLPCTQGQLPTDAKLFNWTTKYQKILLSPKINLFGLLKIAWCSWLPIRNCSWNICKQTQDRHLRAAHTFMDFFSLPLIQEKQAVSNWRNKMVAKQQRKKKNWLENLPFPHNVKIHNMILKKVVVPTK